VPLILLTNDDGIEAEGLRCLQEALQDIADLLVVAPDRERSAVSHGLTIHQPLQLEERSKNRYTLDGTPADCVIYALSHVASDPLPDLIVSGINHGANLGDDIMYSGTVAAAREGSRHGIPSLAVSQAYDQKPIHFKEGVRFIRKLVGLILEQRMKGTICLNINIPFGKIKGTKITRQDCAPHYSHFNFLDEADSSSVAPAVEEYRKRSEIPRDFQAILDRYPNSGFGVDQLINLS